MNYHPDSWEVIDTLVVKVLMDTYLCCDTAIGNTVDVRMRYWVYLLSSVLM